MWNLVSATNGMLVKAREISTNNSSGVTPHSLCYISSVAISSRTIRHSVPSPSVSQAIFAPPAHRPQRKRFFGGRHPTLLARASQQRSTRRHVGRHMRSLGLRMPQLAGIEPGDLATWAAATVAFAAVIITTWQAHEARKSRKAAEEQASAAQTQAEAAVEQVVIMRADRENRHTPEFEVVEAVDCHEEIGYFAIKITLRMNSGPPLSSVKVTPHGEYIGSVSCFSEYDKGPADTFGNLRPGSTFTFYVSCDDGYVETTATVDLECVEEGDETSKMVPRP